MDCGDRATRPAIENRSVPGIRRIRAYRTVPADPDRPSSQVDASSEGGFPILNERPPQPESGPNYYAALGVAKGPTHAQPVTGCATDTPRSRYGWREPSSMIASCSNARRCGPDDELGTLNLITPQTRRCAASLMQEGFSVSMGLDLHREQHQPPQLAAGSPVNPVATISESSRVPDQLPTLGGWRERSGGCTQRMPPIRVRIRGLTSSTTMPTTIAIPPRMPKYATWSSSL